MAVPEFRSTFEDLGGGRWLWTPARVHRDRWAKKMMEAMMDTSWVQQWVYPQVALSALKESDLSSIEHRLTLHIWGDV